MRHDRSVTATNHYLYNVKELNTDLGLDWYDYGARWLDMETGRWSSIDPLAESYQSWSGYNYVLGNPIRLIDTDGRAPEDYPILINGRVSDNAKRGNQTYWNAELLNIVSQRFDYAIENFRYVDGDQGTRAIKREAAGRK